jgi:hypothetical protein
MFQIYDYVDTRFDDVEHNKTVVFRDINNDVSAENNGLKRSRQTNSLRPIKKIKTEEGFNNNYNNIIVAVATPHENEATSHIQVKTDPNDQSINRSDSVDVDWENESSDSDEDRSEKIDPDWENDSSDMSDQEDTEVNDMKRIRTEMRVFEKEHMLTVSEFKLQAGLFDVAYVLDNTTIEDTSLIDQTFDMCMICHETFNEGDPVAVNDKCGQPHCLHIECIFPYLCGKQSSIKPMEKGPNLLMQIKGCAMCSPDQCSGTWHEWTYSTTVDPKWKDGTKLPHPDIDVVGVHQYFKKIHDTETKMDTDKLKFAHFITNDTLFYSIQMHLGYKENIPKKFKHGTNFEDIYKNYESFFIETFTCQRCKKDVYKWKEVYFNHFGRSCERICSYRICRDCFIMRITQTSPMDTQERLRGILFCPVCREKGRCHFSLTKQGCSAENKSFLLGSYII